MLKISTWYKIIALFSILVLSAVQFFLIYNTYKLSLTHLYTSEKEIINNDYSRIIANDKLYPGGARIIDSILYENMERLESLYNKRNKKEYKILSQKVQSQIFSTLRKNNKLDHILDSIIHQKHLFSNGYQYAVVIQKLEIAFQTNNYINFFPLSESTNKTAKIGGNLSELSNDNLVTGITVSSPNAKTYRIQFLLFIDKDNRTIAILLKMLPIFILSLSCIFSVIILFAITFNNWLKQKKLAEMQMDFINSISHEFNTPLTAIIVANKTLQNGKMVEQSDKLKSMTDVIQRQTTRLNALFKQTLNITRSNHAFINKRSANLNSTIENIIDDYKTNINENIAIEYTSSISPTSTINMDSFWFTTMLQNILNNSIKYNRNQIKKIEIFLQDKNKDFELIIKDNGIGMHQETIKRIFDKFYRYNEKSSKEGGLGLGLFYVYECVKLHNWQIKVNSQLDIGSEFIVTLR